MSLGHHNDGEGFDRSYDRYVARQIRPDGRMLARLERSSEQYLLGSDSDTEDSFDGLCAKCDALVNSPDADAFDQELERLVREEGRSLLHNLLSQVASRERAKGRRDDERDSQWPLVDLALAEALGSEAAEQFSEGLRLLSWRNLLSRHYDRLASDRLAGEQQRNMERSSVEIPDPEIWSLSYSSAAADVCFVAVSTLLGQRKDVKPWIGSLLADVFYRGQQDSVRLLASMLSSDEKANDNLVATAVRFAEVELIDFHERYRRAEATHEAAQAIVKAQGGVGLITPFPSNEKECEDDYPDDDPEEWVTITESA